MAVLYDLLLLIIQSSKISVCLLVLIYNRIGTTCNLKCLRMLLYIRVYMAHALFLKDFIHGDEDTCLLHITEAIIDSRAE